MNDLVDLKRMWKEFNQKLWANSFLVIFMFLLGMFIGAVMVRSSIMDDCRFLSSFRISDSAYQCIRK